MAGGGHAWRGACMGVFMAGGHAWQGGGGVHIRGVCGRRDSYCSGRFASYWNASLFLGCKFVLGEN